MREAKLLEYIAELEARIADDPDDSRNYYELGRVYECVAGDEAKARCCYLSHLIRELGYSDVEEAICDLRSKVDGKSKSIDRINLGRIYAYQGRIEDARAQFERGTRWETFHTEHFALHAVPESTACEEMERFMKMREEALQAVEELFGVEYSGSQPIAYYLYESRSHKGMMTGDYMPAHALIEKAEVHAVYNKNMRVESPHEDAHIVLGQLGRPVKFIEEGAAEFASHGEEVHERCVYVAPRIGKGMVSKLMDDEAFVKSDLFVSYPMAASFVGYLIKEGGIEPFKRLYSAQECDAKSAGIEHPFERIYGLALDCFEEKWRTFLQAIAREQGRRT